jgi:hypothetical protein
MPERPVMPVLPVVIPITWVVSISVVTRIIIEGVNAVRIG